MKKSFKALVGASLAAALMLSGCSDITQMSETESNEDATSELSAASFSRAATYAASTSGVTGSTSSATPTGSGLTGVKAQGWLNSAYIV